MPKAKEQREWNFQKRKVVEQVDDNEFMDVAIEFDAPAAEDGAAVQDLLDGMDGEKVEKIRRMLDIYKKGLLCQDRGKGLKEKIDKTITELFGKYIIFIAINRLFD